MQTNLFAKKLEQKTKCFATLKHFVNEMPSPGFEPESSDRKSEMIGRTTPQGQYVFVCSFISSYHDC